MAKDTLIYLIAKTIEGLVGVLTISAMSYIYEPEDVGKYSTINIAVTTIALVFIQWLVQAVLRYINKYDLENLQAKFYTTVFFSWLKVNVIFFLISSVFILILVIFKDLFFYDFLQSYPLSLIFTAILMFFTYNTAQLIVSMLAGARKTKTNLALSVTNVLGKLLAIILFNNFFGVKIEWLFLSYAIFDFITAFFGTISLKIFKYIDFKENSDEIFKILKAYGIPLMGNMIATSVLNKSDIYIITAFFGKDKAGIYQTNYSIISSAFTLFSAGVMRGSYPTILRTYSEGHIETAKTLIAEASRLFLLLAIPVVFGIFCLSDMIATSLFDTQYFTGHSVMGFVALGMLFLGLTEYAIKPWELNFKTKEIFKRSIISGILNIILNLLFIKAFGYRFAGFSTFLAFFIYFLLAVKGTKQYIKFKINKKSLANIMLASIGMSIFVLLLKGFFAYNILSLFFLVLAGFILYILILFFTGEIKNEIKLIMQKILNNKK